MRGVRPGPWPCASRWRRPDRRPTRLTAAVPRPIGDIAVQTFPLVSWAAKRRVYRLPVIRGVVALAESLGIGLQGARDLGQRPASRGGAGDLRRRVGGNGRRRARVRGRAVLRRPGRAHEPDQAPARLLGAVLARRGRAADVDLPRLPAAALAAAGPAPGVRVPRRRAQGDLLLRGRGRARARAGDAVLAAAPPVRHELPADRDDHGDLRVRADRAAGLVDPRADPDPRRAADRRAVVRGDQVGRAQPPPPLGADRSCTPACSCSG